MAGRTRRARFIVLLVFGVVAFFLYTRNSTPVDAYREYYKQNPIGGGAVIRPPDEKETEQPPAVVGPEPQPTSTPVPLPIQETTSTTTTAQTSSSEASKPTPIVHPPQVPPEHHDDLPYQVVGEGRVEVSIEPIPTHTIEHWKKQPEHFPVSTTIQLPKGTAIPMPRIQRAVNKLSTNGADKERLAVIKASAEHAWKGYKEFAWGMDELRPVTGKVNNPFNAWGATLVDSLDTIWLMGLETEFEEAVDAVRNIDFTTSPRSDIPVFETTIRYLGGLIAAYDVSGRKYRDLLDKAVELAEVLFSVFDTPNRMPLTFFRWRPAFSSQPHRAGNRIILAEIGTLSLEFTRLAQLTGEPKYYDAVARITDEFEKWQNFTRLPGMWPTQLDASGCGKPVQKPEKVAHPDDSGRDITAGSPVKTDGKDSTPQNTSDDPSLSNRKRQLDSIAGDNDTTTHEEKLKNDTSLKAVPRQLQSLGTTGSDVCLPQGLASSSKNSPEIYTLSGASDSMYEYLPKEYILLGGQLDQYRTMYLDSADTMIAKLLFKPMTKDKKDILMSGELKISPNYSQPIEERGYFETFKAEAAHLACFAGGMFAMGGVLFDKPEHVDIGSKLTDGCVWAYNITATGIMPEGAELLACDETWGDCAWNDTKWWSALDPYMEERLNVHDAGAPDYSASPPLHEAVDKVAPDPVPQAEQPPSLAGPPPSNIDPASPPHHEAVDKPAPDLVPQAEQPPSLTGPPPSKVDLEKKADYYAALKTKRQLDDDSSRSEPPRPQPVDWGLGSSDTRDTEPEIDSVYEYQQPLSHEEYVKQKIEEERLPPGFTRITFRKYILRPEAIESVFYMYRITGDQYWRDVGWNMFTSIDTHTRTVHGNSAIDDITRQAPNQVDQMESFWLAETLKYFYLLYDDPDTWSLDEWVLNTEAHLFKRPKYEFKVAT